MFTKLHMEKLIELVRQNPGLYDQSLPTYKDVLWTQNTWQKIAEKLGVEGVEGEELRRKWKNKRDAYRKIKKQLKRRSGSAATPLPKMEFFDQLSFLDTYIEDRSTTSNVPMQENAINDEETLSELELSGLTPQDVPHDQERSDDVPEELEEASELSRSKTMKRKPTMVASTPAKKLKRQEKKEKKTDKLDELIDRMADSLEKTEKEISERTEAQRNDFYSMIGRRAARLSADTQQWMEDEVWLLYRRAQRRDNDASNPLASTSQENLPPPFQGTTHSSGAEIGQRNVFSFLQDSINL